MANSSPRDTPSQNRLSLTQQSSTFPRAEDQSPFGSASKPPVFTPHKSIASTPIQSKISAPSSTQKVSSAISSAQKPPSASVSAQKKVASSTVAFSLSAPGTPEFTSSVVKNVGLHATPLVATAPALIHKSPFASTAEQTVSKAPSNSAITSSFRIAPSAVPSPGVVPSPKPVPKFVSTKESVVAEPSPAVVEQPKRIVQQSPSVVSYKPSVPPNNDVPIKTASLSSPRRVLRSSSRSSSARTTPGTLSF